MNGQDGSESENKYGFYLEKIFEQSNWDGLYADREM